MNVQSAFTQATMVIGTSVLAGALLGGCTTTKSACDEECGKRVAAAKATASMQERAKFYEGLQTLRGPNGRLDDEAAKMMVTMYLQANPADRAMLNQLLDRDGLGYLREEAIKKLREIEADQFKKSPLGQAVAQLDTAAAKRDMPQTFVAMQNVVQAYRGSNLDLQQQAKRKLSESAKTTTAFLGEDLYLTALYMLDQNTVQCPRQNAKGVIVVGEAMRFVDVKGTVQEQKIQYTNANAAVVTCNTPKIDR